MKEIRPVPGSNYTYELPDGHPGRDEARGCERVNMSNSNRVMNGVLDEAKALVTGDRQQHYGLPEINHKRTAAFWSTYLGIEITPFQVCLMNDLQKTARLMESVTHDGLVDKIGFIANAAACRAAELPLNGT